MKRGKITKNAHAKGSMITSVAFDSTSTYWASRGTDHTVRVWDKRQMRTPIKIHEDLFCEHELTDILWSPDDKFIATGTSYKDGSDEFGSVVIIDSRLHRIETRVPTSASSVVRLAWNRKINHIFAGCSDHSIVGFYSPTLSTNGALLCASRKGKKVDQSDKLEFKDIINPGALPLFRK